MRTELERTKNGLKYIFIAVGAASGLTVFLFSIAYDAWYRTLELYAGVLLLAWAIGRAEEGF